MHQIQCGIGRRAIGGSLRSNHHYGNRRILHHERQSGRRVVHRVGAMTNYYAVNALFDLVADGLGEFDILRWSHVFAEDRKQFFRIRVHISASSGTAPYSSPGEKAGITAPVR